MMTFKKVLRFWLCIMLAILGIPAFNSTHAVTKYARVVIVGNLGSGKTSLWNSFFNIAYNPNEDSSDSMIRRDYTADVGGGDSIQFNIWDTAGMAKYYDEVVAFTKDANFVLIVHDISARYDPNCRAYLTKLYRDVHSRIKADGQIFLVGTKYDLRHNDIVNASDQIALVDSVAKAIPCSRLYTEAPKGRCPIIDDLLQKLVAKASGMSLPLADPDSSTLVRFKVKRGGGCTLL